MNDRNALTYPWQGLDARGQLHNEGKFRLHAGALAGPDAEAPDAASADTEGLVGLHGQPPAGVGEAIGQRGGGVFGGLWPVHRLE